MGGREGRRGEGGRGGKNVMFSIVGYEIRTVISILVTK